MIYLFERLSVLYAISSSVVLFIPQLKRFHRFILIATLVLSVGIVGGVLGMGLGAGGSCGGSFCSLGAAVQLGLLGFIVGVALGLILFHDLRPPESSNQYKILVAFHIVAAVFMLYSLNAYMAQQHISLVQVFLHWY